MGSEQPPRGSDSKYTFAEWTDEAFQAAAVDAAPGGVPLGEQGVLEETPGRYQPSTPAGELVDGEYEIGRGGIGRVLVVWDQLLGRVVAMKVLDPADGSSHGATGVGAEAVRRFLREARITAQLDHPGILPVHELGRRAGGQLYYTMKYVSGETLAAALARLPGGEEGLRMRLRLLAHFGNLCQAVAYAHSKGVVHRDLKPENVMVGEFGETVLLDWGLARLVEEPEGRRAVMGTPAYMSPEQAAGRLDQVDQRSDVWSLGAVLYEILSGCTPVSGGDTRQVLEATVAGRVHDIEQVCPEAPPELRAVVRKALSIAPDERYPSARELADEIEAWRSGEQVSAYRYSELEQLRLMMRRHRRELVVGLVVGAVAVLLLSFQGLRSYGRVLVERDRAVEAERAATAQAARARRNLAEAYAGKAGRASEVGEYAVARVYAAAALALEERPDARGIAMALGRAWHPTLVGQRRVDPPCRDLAWSADPARPDGAVLACASEGVLRVWGGPDDASGWEREGLDRVVNAVAISPDGRWVAAGGSDAGVRVFGRNGALSWELSPHAQAVWGIAFSPDGARMATASRDHTVALWDLDTQRLIRRYRDHDDWVWDTAFSPDGRWLASSSSDGSVRLRGLDGGGEQVLRVPRSGGFALAFDPRGGALAAGYGDRAVRLWDLDSGAARVLEGHEAGVWDLAYSPDGALLASGSADHTVRLWWADSAEQAVVVIGHTQRVYAVAFSPDGRRLITAGDEGLVRTWSMDDRDRGWLRAPGDGVVELAVSPDGRQLAAVGDEGGRIWRADTRAELLALSPGEALRSVAFGPDGRTVAAGGADGRIRLWRDGEPAGVLEGHSDEVGALAFSPDGRALLSGGDDHEVILWELADGVPRWRGSDHDGAVNSVTFSPDGARVVSGSSDWSLKIWSAADGALERTLEETGGRVKSVAFSPDGHTLASGSRDGAVRIWSMRDLTRPAAELTGHENGVFAVAFSPDGRLLATGSWDGRVRLWDLARGKELAAVPGHSGGVSSVAFLPDGATLVSGGWDGVVRFLDLSLLDAAGDALLAGAEQRYGLTLRGATVVPDPDWEPAP